MGIGLSINPSDVPVYRGINFKSNLCVSFSTAILSQLLNYIPNFTYIYTFAFIKYFIFTVCVVLVIPRLSSKYSKKVIYHRAKFPDMSGSPWSASYMKLK